MKIQVSELENGIRLISLNGKLDNSGVYAVETDFVRHCAEGGMRILVDLSNVGYISSIGIPMLVATARIVKRRGGTLAFLNPQKHVLDVLDLVGVLNLVPVYYDLRSAKLAL